MLLALALYEESLCTGCGEPKDQAWHSELDGFYEAERFVCHACTAKRDDDKQTVFVAVRSLYPDDRLPLLTPLEIGINTTPPVSP